MDRRTEPVRVTAMAKLETKQNMSPLQFGITLVEISIGTEIMVILNKIVTKSEQTAWLSILLGGFIFGISALLMVKLGEQFPEDTLVEYFPKLWGRIGSRIILWWFNLLFLLISCSALASFSKIITFYFFDRTPTEVVELGMLTICIYAALQDLGTLLRIMQLLFFTVMPVFFVVSLTSLLNFRPENILPLWPDNLAGVVSASFSTWPAYSGYELIMLLLPLTSRGKTKITSAVSWAFGYITFVFTMLTVLTIGVLTAEGVKGTPYPILSVVRGIQIPGTFVERLEGYFLLIWIPIAFDSLFMLLWGLSQVLMRHSRHADHRPFVLAIGPLIYAVSVLLDSMGTINAANQLTLWLGVGFSLGIVPLSLILTWRKRGGVFCGKSKSEC